MFCHIRTSFPPPLLFFLAFLLSVSLLFLIYYGDFSSQRLFQAMLVNHPKLHSDCDKYHITSIFDMPLTSHLVSPTTCIRHAFGKFLPHSLIFKLKTV